jgi:anti-sigma B factor antagonist
VQPARSSDKTAPRAGFSAPRPFDVEIRPGREQVVVAPCGELDCATVDRLEAAVDSVVAAGRNQIVLDLRALSFMDSTGLCAIVRQANRTDATVALIDGAPAVARLFDLTAVRQLLTFIEPNGPRALD